MELDFKEDETTEEEEKDDDGDEDSTLTYGRLGEDEETLGDDSDSLGDEELGELSDGLSTTLSDTEDDGEDSDGDDTEDDPEDDTPVGMLSQVPQTIMKNALLTSGLHGSGSPMLSSISVT